MLLFIRYFILCKVIAYGFISAGKKVMDFNVGIESSAGLYINILW